ncbi:MAG TPA: lantibiotic dehydratase [Streptosporangiaceae bacterium]|nr:lantibiotic dehydratase [Streptosporangiaceae bacterium]
MRQEATTAGRETHLVPLPGTDWKVWRDARLRTTGFSAEGLDRLSAPDCAAVADAHLAGQVSSGIWQSAFDEALARCSGEVLAIASDPAFREAVIWQNPGVLRSIDEMLKAGPQARRNARQRERERLVARYWQRYCAKAETIGFFGPVCWVQVDPATRAVVARPGPALLRDRWVDIEHWALAECAERIAANPSVRPWLPPALQPQLTLRQLRLLDPVKTSTQLAPAEAAVVACCDGRRAAADIARDLAADQRAGLRKAEDVYLLLERLAAKGILRWTLDVPVHPDSERLLRDRIMAIAEPEARSWALAQLERLTSARVKVSSAAGRPEQLADAIRCLEAEFAQVTGATAVRKPGQAYAARRVYREETTRDLTVTIGGTVLDAVAAPLAILLQAARWLSEALAEAYLKALGAIHADLSAELGSAEVPLGQLWFLAQGLFYGSGDRPADRVQADFSRRWAELIGIDQCDTDTRERRLRSTDLAPALAQMFPARCPGWPDARVHSPDLQICAESLDELNAGRFFVVLSELHVAFATNAYGASVSAHPDQPALRAALAADMGGARVRPLLPTEWPRNTSRLAFALGNSADVQLGILPAPGANPDQLLPITAMSVSQAHGTLVAKAPDGRCWPLTVIFAQSLSEVAVDMFKHAGTGLHTPRILIDNMVVSRETWRPKLSASGLTRGASESERYLAVRRWRHALGLPERVFVAVASEVKPMFVDLTSPQYAASLLHMLNAARAASGDEIHVVVTEMLPLPHHAWVPDAQGRRYLSELRLQVRDPAPASD